MMLGENIRLAREAMGLSQEAAARKIGVSLVTWNRWERGHVDIPSSRIPEIAEVLGTSPVQLWAESHGKKGVATGGVDRA